MCSPQAELPLARDSQGSQDGAGTEPLPGSCAVTAISHKESQQGLDSALGMLAKAMVEFEILSRVEEA
jgi:hypothetical protein